ncbi:uncharacterized protein BDR25DRAFT_335698 [Lindgomyces ingoldianus]|uniref:Uncharacterized protein n=1 Tax=Lindgomyces ingoldianus TaxID=673940 RepID=A0ACB6QMP1_9PLEO|nr:uncharacterized protein BDR25DRAFT_335698 [Lindgomyces ingoldianus]KAF2467843.1 hypothetical protein BDR25DRAFT_335698 [Lindgomyces ingoldianus]
MAAETSHPPPESAAKFSRYRSVRRAQQQQQLEHLTHDQATPPIPAMPPIEPQKDATVSRSMSRYHRRPTTSHSATHAAPSVRSSTEQVPPLPRVAASTSTSSSRNRAPSSPQAVHNGQPRLPNTSKARTEATPLVEKSARGYGPSQAARDEAKQLMQAEAERHRRMQEKLKAEKRARLEAEEAERARLERLRKEEEEAERLRAQREAEEAEQLRRQKEEQDRGKRLQKAESASRLKKREEEERKAKYEEAARKTPASPPVSPPRHGGGFGLFKRRKDDAPGSPESPAKTGRPRQTSNGNREHDTIRPGGGGAVLGIDAPISAVNAGDRRVMVVCNKSHILLPVTPTTTPLDLIRSAANCLTESIDVRTAVILESFQKVGLQRPLRNYEHVRDVMNSWDDDKQNDLLISDSVGNSINQQDLLASQVPDSKPEGMGCYIHYSSKPGKWSKRYFTLRSDGQLVMSKSETSKDHENICHLSDFDIYSPTERKLAKQVKPPKKICYAVKSQQKSNMFMDESRFVHFFCTNDKHTASLFHGSVQGWRSWYLKHVMGEGQKKSKAADPAALAGFSSNRNVSGSTPKDVGLSSHARNASVGSHYQLGSFMPLLDLDQFGKDSKDEENYVPGSFPDDAPLARMNTRAMHARKMSTRTKGPPPLSYGVSNVPKDNPSPTAHRLNSLTQSNSSHDESDTFASGGLLGRTYIQRQKTMQEREHKSSGPSGAFAEGSNLLNNINTAYLNSSNGASGLGRQSSVRSTHRRTSSDIQRSTSTRVKPKPLVDLTPQYREPPQHANKGKGFNVSSASGPLIENATSIEEAIKIPSSTDWRARPTTSAGRQTHGTYGIGRHERTRSLRGGQNGEGLAAYTVNNHSGAPEDDSNAFTGGGLLARAKFGQGSVPVGHGVMDGSKARGPMLDLRENSKFASGSLLAGVERKQGPTGPALDRDKRRSVDLG